MLFVYDYCMYKRNGPNDKNMLKHKSLIFFILFPFICFGQSIDATFETAITIDSTIFHEDASYLDGLIDHAAFVRNVFKHYDLSQEELLAYEESFQQDLSIGEIVIAQTGEYGEYHFLKVTEFEQKKALLFRQLDDDHWLSYHFMMITEDRAGKIWVSDIFLADVGMWVSEVVSTAIALDTTIPMKNETYRKRLLQLDSMFVYNEEAQYDQSLKVYQKMSPFFQKQRPVKIAAMMSSSLSMNEELFNQLVGEYQSSYPYDISLYLNLLEINERKHKTEKAIQSLDMLDDIIGGDPYLTYRKAENYTSSGYFSKAEKICKKLIKQETLVVESKLLLMECHYWKGGYQHFLRELISLSELLNVEPVSIFNENEYVDFFNSEVWANYIAKEN